VITANDVSVWDNTWNNATHTVTYNSGATFDETRHAFCPFTATTGVLIGTESFPMTIL
jgi:hypothetical protein